jgi:lipoyl(octanoyl) transferase
MVRPLHVRYMGRLSYGDGLLRQRELAEQRKQGLIEDTLLLLEHDPVVTLGRNGDATSIKGTTQAFEQAGVELVESDRGGDATFHGPGQVVAYAIIDLRPDRKDIRRYVRTLEEVMIQTLAEYGLDAGRMDGAPGAWFSGPDRKIGAIGARVSRWVTHHGLALNVNTDLSCFDLIVPCGLQGKGVTSLEAELGRRVSMIEVMEHIAKHMGAQFERQLVIEPTVGAA